MSVMIHLSTSVVSGGSGGILSKLFIIVSWLVVYCKSSSVSIGGGGSVSTLDSLGGNSAGGGGVGVGASSNNFYVGNDVWFRNLDNQLLRLGSRLDQLMIRMDHLDSRVGRVQSQGHLRFDSIETSMQTTRQRLDLWSNQLNLIEEQLTRKWKNMESRFDSLVSTLDTKLDTKFNLIQRDNRRHNEFISSSFNSVIISQEKLAEKMVNALGEINSTLQHTSSSMSNSTRSLQLSQSVTQNNTIQLLENFSKNLTRSCNGNSHHHHVYNPRSNLVYEQNLPSLSHNNNNHHHHARHYQHNPFLNNNNNATLISTKVSNMFDELVKRGQDLEAIVKDTFTMSNLTRREVQDGFRAVIPIMGNVVAQGGNTAGGAGTSSAEIMSAMIVESLTSVESMTTSLSRRMTELTRSVEERFEMVSMTLDGFLVSCLRIQEKTPLLEERIADVLDRLLDTVDSRTRNATESWANIHALLRNYHHHHHQRLAGAAAHHQNVSCLEKARNASTAGNESSYTGESWGNMNTTESEDDHHLDNQGRAGVGSSSNNTDRSPDDELDSIGAKLDTIGDLSEDEKNRFWESWLAPRSSNTNMGNVPEEEE